MKAGSVQKPEYAERTNGGSTAEFISKLERIAALKKELLDLTDAEKAVEKPLTDPEREATKLGKNSVDLETQSRAKTARDRATRNRVQDDKEEEEFLDGFTDDVRYEDPRRRGRRTRRGAARAQGAGAPRTDFGEALRPRGRDAGGTDFGEALRPKIDTAPRGGEKMESAANKQTQAAQQIEQAAQNSDKAATQMVAAAASLGQGTAAILVAVQNLQKQVQQQGAVISRLDRQQGR